MGNAASKYSAYGKLVAELPAVKTMEYDDNWLKVDKSMGVFADNKDKEQFIYAIIAITTANGTLDLSGADYKLFYSRRQSPAPASPSNAEDLLYASVAAILNGKIIAKIEPSAGGMDQKEAFLAFKRDVEVKLDRVLQSVPSASSNETAEAGPSTMQSLPHDLPPSYQSSAVDMAGPRREKA